MFIKKTSAITAPFLLFLLALLLFLPLEVFAEDQPIANIPTVVEGRVLSSVKAGDSSDWIEIAREGSFSLILRKEALPLGGVLFDSSNPYYPTSSARYQVNSWFNNTLAASAGLRNFTVANTSLAQLGYFTNANLGFSRPNGIAARNGDDVAFLLNFAEAASFCSIQYFEGINYIQSNAAATRNYNKLSSGVNSNAWWLRTTGSGTESPGLFACTVGYDGAVYQTDKTSSVPLLRPALWVDSGIFSENVSYTNTSANTNNYDESANNIPVAPIIVAPPVEQEVFYTLAYNGNGGKGVPPTQEVLGNTNIPVSSIIPINEEFPFLGWANSSNATTAEYQPGDSIFLTNNTTLYAVWDTQIAPIFIALPAEGVVNGRTLTAYRAGDSSDWVEVAQNGGYSLIVRKDCLMNLGRVTFADVETSSYRISHVRDLVNYWFKNTLSSSANLRDFTMQNTALENLGDFTVMTYGLSQPTSVAARTGDDVAFLLSFAEAASYCSLQYANPGGTSFTVSSTIAKNNYYRLNKPGEGIMNDFWWLRSPGHNSNGVATACSVGTHGGIISEGSVYTSSSRAAYPYVRPALWVDSGIFEDNTFTLSYDANGGVGAPPPQTAPANSYLTISTIVPTLEDYMFLGWSTTMGATKADYQPGGTIFLGSNIKLYAVWKIEMDLPGGVNGRILTKDKSGDVVNWVEIARYGKYSLIVRSSYLNIYAGSGRYGDPAWQFTSSYGATNNYATSNVRNAINAWFNGSAPATGDNLPTNARMRKYTMQNNALTTPGTASTVASLTNGLSRPSEVYLPYGNDVSFALSYTESANFCSTFHFLRNQSPETAPSNSIATANFAKITIPGINGSYVYGAWLRSPGDYTGPAGTTAGNLGYTGIAFQFYINYSAAQQSGLVYPALWVDSAIWDDDYYTLYYDANGGNGEPPSQPIATNTSAPLSNIIPTLLNHRFLGWAQEKTATIPEFQPGDLFNIGNSDKYLYAVWEKSGHNITGYVYPLATNDLSNLGVIGFLDMHKVIVELRSTFLTPAPAPLRTVAVLQDQDGLGKFTFTDVEPGNYILYIHRPGYIVRAMKVSITNTDPTEILLAPPGSMDAGIFNLWAGDSNGDLSIDGKDLMMVMELLAEQVDIFDQRYNPACDFNADGLIEGKDVMIIYQMWMRIIWDYPGAEDIDVFS